MATQQHIVNIRMKLMRIRREMDETIEYLNDSENNDLTDNKRPKCKQCGWRNLGVRKDKTYLCKSCGYDSKK